MKIRINLTEKNRGPMFFTSDTHFGHLNIIKYCNRPFPNEEEMDQAMIDHWNSVVPKNGIVYHLGDFCRWHGNYDFKKIRSQLNGEIHLVVGNHDSPLLSNPEFCSMFESIHSYVELTVVTRKGKKNFALFHYPIESWWRKSIHLHGHIHSKNEKQLPGRIDVGADAWNYTPVSLDQILNFS